MNEEFEKWFRAEVVAERMCPADEEGARAAWQESRKQAIEEASAICDEEGNEWDSDNLITEKNYAHACRDRIRGLQKE